MNKELHKVLQAREKRSLKRSALANLGWASLSLSLNIPGYPKSNAVTEQSFSSILKDLEIFLKAHRIFVGLNESESFIDEAGQLFLIPLEEQALTWQQIKTYTEKFESQHPLGRIIDVDVFDQKAKPVSSGKKKTCFICENKAAVDCMREMRHTYEELRTSIFKQMKDFNRDRHINALANSLSEFASKALLYEVSLSPKPGLVNFYDSGSHQDMNFYTFLNSISALSPYWKEFTLAGYTFNSELSEALPEVRQIGLKMEQAMFEASKNVNTQKGLIFLLGLSIFCIAYLDKEQQGFEEANFVQTLKKIGQDLVELELNDKTNKSKTHGESTYEKYGNKGAGARYQAEHGLPIVFELALPYLEKHLKQVPEMERELFDQVLNKTLLQIMSQLDDSNVLYRKGDEIAQQLKEKSQLAFEDEKQYNALKSFCLKENISPGGSADILALSLFFYFFKRNHLNKN